MELPRAITPTVAGLTVGGFVGVVGVIAVLLLVGRGSRRPTERPVRMPAPVDQVVFIPPYGTLQRDTPLPAAAFQVPPTPAYTQPLNHAHLHAPLAPGPALPFRPSSDLSARAFAKMGYGVEVQVEDERDLLASGRELHGKMPDFEDDDIRTKAWASSAPTLPVEESGPVSALKAAPHPLGIIPARSSAMQAAPLPPPMPPPARVRPLAQD